MFEAMKITISFQLECTFIVEEKGHNLDRFLDILECQKQLCGDQLWKK